MKVWVVLPTYNESANLALMVSTLLEGIPWHSALPVPVRQRPLSPTLPREGGGSTTSPLAGHHPRPRSGPGEGVFVALSGDGRLDWSASGHPFPSDLTNGHSSDLSPQSSVLSPESSLFGPHFSVFSPHFSVFSPQSSVLSPQPSVLSPQSSVLSPQSSVLSPQPSVLSPQPSALSPQPSALSPQSSFTTPQVSILIVDDNSPDGSGALADELAQQHPGQIMVLHRPRKLGLGTAYRAGFNLALQNGADVAIEMDADFSHSPTYLPAMLSLLEDHDVVVGSRWAPGGSLDESWETWRYLLSKYANVYARWVTGLDVYDTTAGFKAFRADALRKLPLERVRSDGYAFQIEMATACQRSGLRVAELPIHFEERARGKSKMSWRIICEAAWRVWQIKWRW